MSSLTPSIYFHSQIYLAPERHQQHGAKNLYTPKLGACPVEQGQLAKWLVDNSCADRVFFCNSGAEAVEASIKVLFFFSFFHS